jgi:hypothetical protein
MCATANGLDVYSVLWVPPDYWPGLSAASQIPTTQTQIITTSAVNHMSKMSSRGEKSIESLTNYFFN